MPDSGEEELLLDPGRFAGRKVVVAVTGGIAAYKSCSIVRELIRNGAEVQVVMSRAACEFVTPLTFATLSGRPVLHEMFPDPPPADPVHLNPAGWGDLFLVAPATADFIGKLTHGLADDLPSTIGMAFPGTILLAPAMNPKMWQSPAVQENLRTLHARGVLTIGPEAGLMGGIHEQAGVGRMSEPEAIVDRIEELLGRDTRWQSVRLLVTSGPTQEALDPVRCFTNRSSGKMGDAIARAAAVKGAEVILIRGKGAAATPPTGVTIIEVASAAEMAAAVKEQFPACHALVMAAAVSDWTIANPGRSKLKKESGPPQIEWVSTEDILAWAGAEKGKRVVVGFALETTDHLSAARKKLAGKNADLIILNDATTPDSRFGGDTARLTLIPATGQPIELPLLTKRAAAGRILEAVADLLPR